MTKYRKYKRAFRIACELLNGDVIYGIDRDKIIKEALEKDGCVCCFTYEEFILNNLDRFSDNDEVRHRAMSGGGESASPYRFDYCPYCGADMRESEDEE